MVHVAGLLHDIGRLGLLAAHPDEYTRLALSALESIEGILEAERSLCGMDHCSAGLLLARAWHLPEALQVVIAGHHGEARDRSILSLVQLCCRLADDLMFPATPHRAVALPTETVQAYAPVAVRQAVEDRISEAQRLAIEAIRSLDF
jgi:HD-like signal output (HDOD) protein